MRAALEQHGVAKHAVDRTGPARRRVTPPEHVEDVFNGVRRVRREGVHSQLLLRRRERFLQSTEAQQVVPVRLPKKRAVVLRQGAGARHGLVAVDPAML